MFPLRLRNLSLSLLFLMLLACGDGGTINDAAPEQETSPALEAVLRDLEREPVPAGVDESVFAELKTELASQLAQQDVSKLVSRKPDPFRNQINDLELVQNEDGSTSLWWTYQNRGDYDMNREVNAADLAPIAAYFLSTGPFAPGSTMAQVDGDGNGEINAADISPLAGGFLARVDGYNVYAAGVNPEDGCWQLVGTVLFNERHQEPGMIPRFSFNVTDYLDRELMVLAYATDDPADPNGDPEIETTPPQPPPATTGTLSGVVTDLEGNPLEGAAVSLGEQSVETDSEGAYLIADLEPVDDLVVSFRLDGYADGTVNTGIFAGEVTDGSARLIPRVEAVEIDPIAGGPAPVAGFSKVQISLPPGGLVRSDGAPLEELSDLQLTYIDPTVPDQLAAAPPLRAELLSGDPAQLESFGMAEVVIDDGIGGQADLAEGRTAEMTFEIPLSQQDSAPETIGLYSFDEAAGTWIEEGVAIKNQAGTAYIGNVGHFSFWNVDKPAETTCISVLVTDEHDLPVPGAVVTAEGVDYAGTTHAATNVDGIVTFNVLRGATERLSAKRWLWSAPAVEITTPAEQGLCRDMLEPPLVATLVMPDGNIEKSDAYFDAFPTATPLTMSFDASQSSGGVHTAVTSFEWDWDGPDGPLPFEHHGLDDIVEHTFEAAGVYRVSLRVTNKHGAQETMTRTVCVLDGE